MAPKDNRSRIDQTLGWRSGLKVFMLSAGMLSIMFLALQWWIQGNPFFSNPEQSQTVQPSSEKPSQSSPEKPLSVSSGQYSLFNQSTVAAKAEGMDAISAGDFLAATNAFKAARETDISDPETLIYLNNARIAEAEAYELAVIVPAAAAPAQATSLLKGVAQAQNEINQAGGIQGKSLRLLLGDDQDSVAIAQEIATQLSQKANLVGVIGHSSAATATAAATIYKDQSLALISTSTAVKPKPYIQPMLPGSLTVAKALVSYLIEANYYRVTLFYDGNNDDSHGLKANFETVYGANKGIITEQLNLANLSPKLTAKSPKADTVVLLPGNSPLKATTDSIENILYSGREYRVFGSYALFNPDNLGQMGTMANQTILAIPDQLYQSGASPFSDRPLTLWQTIANLQTTASYNAAQLMISGLKQMPSRQGVSQAMATSNNNSVRLLKVSINQEAITGYELLPIALIENKPSD